MNPLAPIPPAPSAAPARSTVLIVDDVARNRETLLALLDLPAYRLIEAADGPQALRLAAENPPDVILLDVMMPGMDGFEVCRRLRADPRLAEIPVLLITALDDRSSRLAGLEAGADDFIAKPFDGSELRARVHTITRLNRYRRLAGALELAREQADIIDRAGEAIVVTDLDGRISYWNRGAAQLYGLPAAEAVGRLETEVFPPALVRQLAAAPDSPDEGGDWRGEVALVRGTGRPATLDVHRMLIRDDAGRPRARLSFANDITERKNTHEQLLRVQRLENIGLLAAGIAHDLNNVLAPIMLAAPMLRLHATHPSDLHVLTTVEKSAERGAALVRQIIGFAHGTGAGEKQLVQVRHLLRDLVSMIQETFPKNIRFNADIASDLWTLQANSTQIHQVALNLCVNARDAMPGGGTLGLAAANVRLTEADARAIPGARSGAHVRIEVSDTGTGIPPEVLERIWEPFFTTKAEGKGTGLGLSTVRSIVADHCGFLAVETQAGSGTTFRAYFPAAEAGTAHGRSDSLIPVPRAQGECVLIVDDEEHLRETLRAILLQHGYRVLTAGGGIEALTVFTPRTHEIKLVISDFNMPGIDGGVLAKLLRTLNPDVKLLLCSGQLDNHEEAEAVSHAFLSKPFTTEVLLATVHAVLHDRPFLPAPSCSTAA